jgi:hypothetical protein
MRSASSWSTLPATSSAAVPAMPQAGPLSLGAREFFATQGTFNAIPFRECGLCRGLGRADLSGSGQHALTGSHPAGEVPLKPCSRPRRYHYGMSVHHFLLALVTGSAVIGLWLAVRFPSLAPESLKANGIAMAVAVLMPTLALPLFVPVGHVAGVFVAIFVVMLPVLVYLFMAGAWFMMCMRRMLASHMRSPQQ